MTKTANNKIEIGNFMKDKIVVITGATGGIGYGVAKKFAGNGANLVINGLASEDEMASRLLELKELGAPDVMYCKADLSKPAEIDLMFEDIFKKFDRVDILINNAGIQFVSAVDTLPAEKWEMIIRVCLNAPFYTIKNVLPSMKKNKWGRIINIGSAHALVASPFKSAYVAAKHGIHGLTKSVALEVAQDGITVNTVCPGYVRTEMVLGQVADTAKVRNMLEADVINNVILGAHAIKKFVEVEEVASFIYYLCGKESGPITGAALSIDCGWTTH
jgi:3-hydroxybutyrate dehydrogenase